MACRRPLAEIGNTLAPGIRYSEGESKDQEHSNVAHLIPDIMRSQKSSEGKFRPSSTYMSRQPDISEKMRGILVDWLVDVHLKFKLLPETLYLSISLIDRFLDLRPITRSKLQLVGVVAMLIAAKYEEMYPPEIRDFIYISANTYTKDDILKMERLMLSALDFSITSPSLYFFLRRTLQVAETDEAQKYLALYLSELALQDYRLLQHAPSNLAAGCVFLARKALRHADPWTKTLEHSTTYSELALQPVVQLLREIVLGAPHHKCQAIRKKYSHPKLNGTAELSEAISRLP